jgi:arylsulfatase A-like enzyme
MKHWRGHSGLFMSLGKVPLVFALALGASAVVAGCSSASSGEHDERGSLGVSLQVAPGVTLSSVTYAIAGNGFNKTGTIDVSGAPAVSATIGGIPAGSGYTLTLTATATDGTTFSGSASFDVTAGSATSVTIHLKGSPKGSKGSVDVNGTFNVAPVIDELTVTPRSVFVGNTITLKAIGSDADEGPSPVTYYWSTTGGVIDDPIASNATLTSDSPGTFTVKLTVSDGESTHTTSSTVTFVRPEDDGGGGAGGSGGEGGGEDKSPNILFITVDDLGAEGTAVYPDLAGDSGQVPVPNIEALADNGLVFDNAWSSPACSPTRGTIISGQYAHRTGVTAVGNVLPTSTVTLFDRLTAESPSYSQAFFGKYHVGGGSIDPVPNAAFPAAPGILQHVRDIGITRFRGILGGGVADYFNWTTFDINEPAVATTTYATTALTDYAIDYIHNHEQEKPDEPWFIYQAYNAPHAANGGNSPYQVPPRELHSVDLSSVGNPAPGTYATNIPVYQANIQSLDTEIGRLLAEVDLANTVVIFVGDNGTPSPVKDTGTKLRNSKGSAYEGGVRAPLVIAGAGVTRRGREDALVVSSDYYATILGLAGVPVSQVNNSYSIEPLLSNEAATSGRTHAFTEITSGTTTKRWAIKDTRYKLLNDNGVWALYDLVADPLETTDLYASASHAAARASLESEISLLKAQAPAGYFP